MSRQWQTREQRKSGKIIAITRETGRTGQNNEMVDVPGGSDSNGSLNVSRSPSRPERITETESMGMS